MPSAPYHSSVQDADERDALLPTKTGDFSETPIKRKETNALNVLTATVWVFSALFGVFSAVHYVGSAVTGDWDSWDSTDPGLYRQSQWTANYLMVSHLSGGVFLMLAGPIQLILPRRDSWLVAHRVIGRLYITAALIASTTAVAFCSIYSNARNNPHENIGNSIFGTLAFACALQSYLHVKRKQIQLHKIWSYRLYSVILGALLYRLYVTNYYGLILYTPWEGCEWFNNSLLYCVAIPNLIVVELLWRGKFQPRGAILWGSAAFVAVSGTLLLVFSWIPAILGLGTSQGQVLQDQISPG